MRNNLTKHYDKFTAKERVNLILAALVREDKEEFLRLRDSCPKECYMSIDAHYRNYMDNLNLIGISYNLYCEQFIKEILCNRAIRDIYGSRIRGYERGFFDALGAVGDIPENRPVWYKIKEYTANCHRDILKAEKQIKDAISKLEAVKGALKSFCEKVGVDFDNMSAWISFQRNENILEGFDLFNAKPDEDIVEQLKSDFLELWKR